MKINLRKAASLQNAIREMLDEIRLKYSVEITEFENVESKIQTANDELFANDARRQKLLLAYYNIRALVGTANASCGITNHLARAAFIDKRIAQLKEIVAQPPFESLAVVKGRVEKLGETPERHGLYYSDTVQTGVVGKEQIAQAEQEILNLKRQKQEVNDEILRANVETEIPLSEDTVETLKQEGLIDG